MLCFDVPYFQNNILNILFIAAPGAYDVEKAEKVIHHSTGAVTFGIKYKDRKPDDIPGNCLL